MRGRSIVAALGVVALLAPTAATAAPAGHGDRSTRQGYFWRWSDGSQSASRTFRESQYVDAGRLPRLVVTAVPAEPSRSVVLQFRQGSRWLTETTARTDGAGVARLSLYPYCEADRWCRETIAYRLVVAGQTADLTIRYR